MAFTLTIVGFAVALFAIVMIHELGHYLVARAYGFRVLEYFLGCGLLLGMVLAVWGRPAGPWRIDDVPPTVSETPSPAFQAGLQPGDVIVSIAGVPTSDPDSLKGVVTDHIGQPVPVVVTRG